MSPPAQCGTDRQERSFLDSILAELHRRRVFRVGTAYAVVAFVLLQVAEITFEPLALPPWALTGLILAIVLLFPVVMTLAWIFDLTPRGLRRTQANADTSRRGGLVVLTAVVALDAAAAWFLYDVYGPTPGAAPARQLASAPGVPPAFSATGTASAPPPGSVAVLPFEDLDPAAENAYFAKEFSVDIHSLLNRAEGLRVPGRSSSFAFGDRDVTPRRIGEMLNVGALLEGTIRRSEGANGDGDRVRVTADLVDIETGYSLWSGRWDRRTDEILAVQDEIVAAVVRELTEDGDVAMADPGGSRAPASFEAFDRYLEGRDLWRERTPASLERAIAAFEDVIALDPSYAPAYSGLADAHLLLAAYGNLSMGEAVREATPRIFTALELDGELSEGFASLGLLYWNLGRNGAAEGHLRHALDLDDENIEAYAWLSGLVGSEGRLGEQEAILRQGLEKDPLNLLLNINLAANELQRGRIEAGFERLHDTREVFPTRTLVLRTLAQSHAGTGSPGLALAFLDDALALAPDEPPNHALLADILMQLGALDAARRALDDAEAVGSDNLGVTLTRAEYLWRTERLDALERLAHGLLEHRGEDLIAGKESVLPQYWLGRILLRREQPRAAAGYLTPVTEDLDGLPPMLAIDLLTWLTVAHDAAGAPEAAAASEARAAQLLEALHLQGVAGPQIAYFDAVMAALAGDVERALSHLANAVERGWLDAWQAAQDARLAAVHGLPGFDDLLKQVRAGNAAALAGAPERLLAASGPPAGDVAGGE